MRLVPSIIWRYVLKEILSPTFLGLLVYVLVFLMNALFELAELAIKKEMSLSVVLRLLYYLLPRVLELTLPMALLLGILIGVGRLSAESELVALRASGVSYRRVLMPVLVLAGLCWGLSSFLMLYVEPHARHRQRRLYSEQLYSADLRREIKARVFFEEVPGLLLYADEVYQKGDFLRHVFLHQKDQEGREVVTVARRAQIEYDPHSGVAEFLLEGGTNHTISPEEPESYQISHFDRQRFVHGPDESFKMRLSILSRPSPKNYAEQSLGELADSEAQAGKIDHAPTRVRVVGAIAVVVQERFALPFACMAFALIGLPLGIANRRGGKASGFSLSIGIAILYWFLFSFGQNLVREGRLSPYVGMWVANLLLAGLGLLLLYLREQSEGLDFRVLVPGFLSRSIQRMMRALRPGRRSPAARGPAGVVGGSDQDLGEEFESRRLRFLPLLLAAVIVVIGSIFITPFLMVGLALMALISMFSTTLDRHVLRRFLAVLAGCLAAFFTLFLVYEFIQLLDDLVQRNQPATLALTYVAYRVPFVLSQILPMSCLMACLLTFGIMSRFNEVTAVKASGTSIYRLAMPVLVTTLALSIVAYVNYDYIVPYANQKALQTKDTIRGRSPRSYQPTDQRWVFGGGGRLYNFTHYVPPPFPVLPSAGGGIFQGFSIYFLDPASFEVTARIYARKATFESGHWVLREGWSREFHESGESFERFVEKSFDIPEGPGFFVREWKTPEQMTFSELRRLVRELQHRGYDAQELQVDLYSKTSFPLVPLTLVIIGLPFCFRMGRRGSLYGVGVAILVAALYFLTFSATSALGGAGLMPAFLASWAPNILFAGTGAYLLLRTMT